MPFCPTAGRPLGWRPGPARHPPRVLAVRLRLRIPFADSYSATDHPQAPSQGGPSSPGSPCPTPAVRLAGWTHLTALQAMSRASKNPLVHFLPVRGATHFSALAPTTRLIAGKILRDTGPACNITFTEGEVNQA